MASAFIRLMRPHQWIKNGFVFIGLVFGHGWEDERLVGEALALFAAFCLVSSAVYALNDIADRDADRMHPAKRSRPLARGEIGVGQALVLCIALALSGLAIAAAVSLAALLIAAAYVGLNLAYSAGLKRVAILDVFIISGGFMLRILAGTAGIGIDPSKWLLLCGLMLTLFLGFCKRRAELLAATGAGNSGGATGRAALEGYSRTLTAIMRSRSDRLILTLPFVLYGLFRYLQVVYSRGGGADPAWEMLHDPHLIAATAGWLGATGWLLSG